MMKLQRVLKMMVLATLVLTSVSCGDSPHFDDLPITVQFLIEEDDQAVVDQINELFGEEVFALSDDDDADVSTDFDDRPENILGYTILKWSDITGDIKSVKILVDDTLEDGGARYRRVLAHELMHALGLFGHDDNHDTLMFSGTIKAKSLKYLICKDDRLLDFLEGTYGLSVVEGACDKYWQ